MSKDDDQDAIARFWRSWFMDGPPPDEVRLKRLLRWLPAEPRCRFCGAPFHGIGAPIVKIWLGKEPSPYNPQYCNACNDFAKAYGGGAEVDMAMLFADVRGSSQLSEQMSPSEFGKLIDTFYSKATRTLVDVPAFIDRLGGDEVIAFFGSGLSGPDYVEKAIQAGINILEVTGHADPGGPWIPVGAGVNAGNAFFGSVTGPGGLHNITALGEDVNAAARIASQAKVGELLVSQQAIEAAGIDASEYEQATLQLKGLQEPQPVVKIVFRPNTVPHLSHVTASDQTA